MKFSEIQNQMDLPLTLGCEKRRWTVGVNGPEMWTEWGAVDGKMTRSTRLYTEGKQGRTPEQQAVFEAEAAARKKARTGFAPLADGAAPQHRVGTPPLPMLATDWQKIKKKEKLLTGFFFQPKLDGIRCVADTKSGKMFSRTGKELIGMNHISEALRLASEVATAPSRWVDGEIYRHGKGFQSIVSTARRTVNIDPETARQLEFHIFDAVDEAPAMVRQTKLVTWIAGATALVSPGRLDCIRTVPFECAPECDGEGELEGAVQDAMARFEDQGYEGAIIRINDSCYEQNKRSQSLIKAKRFHQEEFRVVEIRERSKQPGIAATVECMTKDEKHFNATPESTIDEKKEMWDNREKYREGTWVATVRFQELTDRGVPRFPVCVGMRHVDDC